MRVVTREEAVSRIKDLIESLEIGIKAIESNKEWEGIIPNVQPKMGQWIKNAEEWQNVDPPYICSECGRASLRQENFCCSCGADMRGDADADSD